MELKISETKQKTAAEFTDWLIGLIGSKGSLHVALSGGSTPKIVFDALAVRGLDANEWKKVHLYWGDERCVPPENSDSNYKMTVEHLLSKIEIPENNVHRIRGEEEPRQEAARYSEVLKTELPHDGGLTVTDSFSGSGKLPGIAPIPGTIGLPKTIGPPRFDLVILGMGDDGHTASIFPHEIGLWHSNKLCAVAEHPETGQNRITITGEVINSASTVAFLVTGKSKAEKVGEIIDQRDGFKSYPANLVRPKSGNLLWFFG